jgi:hypothetical protein
MEERWLYIPFLQLFENHLQKLFLCVLLRALSTNVVPLSTFLHLPLTHVYTALSLFVTDVQTPFFPERIPCPVFPTPQQLGRMVWQHVCAIHTDVFPYLAWFV